MIYQKIAVKIFSVNQQPYLILQGNFLNCGQEDANLSFAVGNGNLKY